jgi:hypothetical protein
VLVAPFLQKKTLYAKHAILTAEMRYAFCHGPNDEKIDAIAIVKMV